jgi:serine/threonine protein phosphatase PrpC
LRFEFADVSDIGHRDENQDRAAVAADEYAALLVVMDGMGGHAEGARAAEVGRQVLLDAFAAEPHPVFDPLGFLHLVLGRAHEAVVAAGRHLPIDQRPRTTCAVCLVQEGAAWWAHLGDARIYHIRHGAVLRRTRDHSHVEQLLREGQIGEDDVNIHPMRNYVDCCLGGEPSQPEMSLSLRQPLQGDDVLLACSDGLWGGVREQDIGAFWKPGGPPLAEALSALVDRAIAGSAPHSDNATAAALRCCG